MATKSDEQAESAPAQGGFIGGLALVLLALAVIVAAWGLIAGATHGWS